MITLRNITTDNLWDILDLKVADDQIRMVASNTLSLAEAYGVEKSGGVALPFGIYHDEILIGFIMFGYGTTGDPNEPKVEPNNYCLWRFMIDKNYQGKGFGKQTLLAAIEYLKTEPTGYGEYVWLSYHEGNERANKLYSSVGFIENGEKIGDEIVMVAPIYK